MNKELKNFIKKTKSDLGEGHPTTRGMINFHRRLKAAALVSKDVFGEGAEVPIATIMKFYEAIVKEEMATVWMQSVQAQIKNIPQAPNKKSVIAEAPSGLFTTTPDKMSN